MRFADFLEDIGGYVSFHPSLTKLCGSTNANIFLSNIFSWTGKGSHPDGWIYKSSQEIEADTGLTYKEQANARKQLVSRGFLEEMHKRFEHKLYFRINKDSFSDSWESEKLVFAKVPKVISGKSQRSFRETTDGQFDLLNTSLPSTTPSKAKKDLDKCDEIMDLWNKIVDGTPFPKIVGITGKRKKDLDSRLKEPDFVVQFEPAVRYLLTQDWACGRDASRVWIADFDYMVRDGIVRRYFEKSNSNQQIPTQTKKQTYTDIVSDRMQQQHDAEMQKLMEQYR
jgi:hypothetical protein